MGLRWNGGGYSKVKQTLRQMPVPPSRQRRALITAMMTPPARGVARGLGGAVRKLVRTRRLKLL